ncbi:glutathione peroxidase [Ideonella sp. A 288]|uniref:glutathione peroxidase n=1 Tax=Ideonella sp. A 288 TaxID=1962181 RepID=UPI000B4B6434|nr:glutathione peroxidase [Ideonella sp. A 288]
MTPLPSPRCVPPRSRRGAWLAAAAVFISAPVAAAPSCPPLLQQVQPRLQDEKPIDLCGYAGKVVLVVNTASFCGYTPQYKALEALDRRYGPQGLVVLGFPSNDFGKQEPGSNKEIADFCENTFGVKFPMFAKSTVSPKAGGPVNPLFAALHRVSGQAPGWNFHKYLIGRTGQPVISHGSAVDPSDPAFVRDLEKLLKSNVN